MSQRVWAPEADPHCGRSSDDWLSFDVGGTRWSAQWGFFYAFGSLAYWVDQTVRGKYETTVAAWGTNTDLLHETAFCLLGGYGVTGEMCHAAYRFLLESLDLRACPSASEVEGVLRQPLPDLGVRYRFPQQRGQRIADAVRHLSTEKPPVEALALRSYLLDINGIGLKTASWIVRNLMNSPEVAIIDIWLVRALAHAGAFRREWRVERDYLLYEQAFLQYASQGSVHPAGLDACIWEQARTVGTTFFDGSQYGHLPIRDL